jgi:hypothetical protein
MTTGRRAKCRKPTVANRAGDCLAGSRALSAIMHPIELDHDKQRIVWVRKLVH